MIDIIQAAPLPFALGLTPGLLYLAYCLWTRVPRDGDA
jgi:hypothetical protein